MSKDNHMRPRRPVKRPSIDGMVPAGAGSRHGSINFQPNRVSASSEGIGAIDNFSRAEGFNPTQQPAIPLSTQNPLARQAGNRPRRSPLKPDPQKRRFGRKGKLKKVRSRRFIIGRRIVLILLALFILIGGFLGWKIWRNTSKVFQGGIFGIFDKTKLKGEDQGRVTILLTGNSADDPGHPGADLTDSIMLISMDTIHNNGFILSIPRDLWVNYGTNGCSLGREGKINAVYKCGEEIKFKQDGLPDGGIGLLEKVIERDFGLDINYYTKLNYTAFKEAVNAVGGIDITIKTDDPRGLYDGNISKADGGPLKLANGVQHLNGQTALNLARARCDTVCYGFTRGDFDRTEHQRQMLLALKDKALSAGTLSNPAKISSLLDSVGNNVHTDFHTNEIRRLYDLIKLMQNVQSIGLADENVSLVQTAAIGGVSAVRPVAGTYDFSKIKAFIKRITSNDPVVKENASVVVLNGSNVDGLAKHKADELSANGINVKAVANTTARAKTIIVFINPSKTATNTYLSQKFKVTSTTDSSSVPEAKNYDADFVIILGSDASSSSQ